MRFRDLSCFPRSKKRAAQKRSGSAERGGEFCVSFFCSSFFLLLRSGACHSTQRLFRRGCFLLDHLEGRVDTTTHDSSSHHHHHPVRFLDPADPRARRRRSCVNRAPQRPWRRGPGRLKEEVDWAQARLMGLAYLHGIDLGWLTWGWLTWSQLIGIYASPMERSCLGGGSQKIRVGEILFFGGGGAGVVRTNIRRMVFWNSIPLGPQGFPFCHSMSTWDPPTTPAGRVSGATPQWVYGAARRF